MGWRVRDGLVLRKAVDANVQEAAHHQTHDGEQKYEQYFHGCLLWTYHRPEVNSSLVLLPDVTSAGIVGTFLSSLRVLFALSLRVPIYRDEAISLWGRADPLANASVITSPDLSGCGDLVLTESCPSPTVASSGRDRWLHRRYSRHRKGCACPDWPLRLYSSPLVRR